MNVEEREKTAKGILYLVATPIGNLMDFSERAIEVLKSVDLIAAEDTRNSLKLLNHFGIRTPMTSYHEFNRFDKAEELVRVLSEGRSVACITDAGDSGHFGPGRSPGLQMRRSGDHGECGTRSERNGHGSDPVRPADAQVPV